nr:hypothetical protein [Tanacetum cinerariifolium]
MPDPDEAVKLAESISLTEAKEQIKKKLKGVATGSDARRVDGLIKSDNEGVEVLSSDDEGTKTDGSEKAGNEKADKEKTGDETTEEDKNEDKKVEKEKAENEKATEEEVVEEQARMNILEILYLNHILQENPAIQRPLVVDTIMTFLLETTTHSPKQQPQKRSKTKVILKKTKKQEEKVDGDVVLQMQIKLVKKVATMFKISHIEAIKEYVQENVTNELKNQLPKYLPKAVSKFVQPRLEKTVRDKSHSFLDHEKHLTLYNALINSMDIDEANVQGNKDKKTRRHDKQDPPADADKDSKNKKIKDVDASPSKKGKTQSKSSKVAKAPTEPSTTNKVVEDEEVIQDDVEDDDAMVQDDDMATNDMPHDDATHTQDDAPEQNWFNEMVNANNDPISFNDLIGDICPYDLSKPLPLQGTPGHTTILVDFFFNKDLEYLKTGNT